MPTIRAVTPTDHPQLAAFLASQYGDAGNSLLAAHLNNPRLLPGMLQIAETDGQIRACALARPMRTQLASAILECAMLTVVPADLRDELLESLLAGCLVALADVGATVIFAQGAAQIYVEFGLATYRYQIDISLPTASAGRHGVSNRPMRHLRPATVDDHDDIAALYAASYRTISYSEVRSPADWRSWPIVGAALVCEDARGRVVGYVLIHDDSVVEAGAADAGAARALIAVLTDATSAAPGWHLPIAHIVTQAALHIGGEVHIRASQPHESVSLAGVLDVVGAFTQLLPVFAQRLAGSRYERWSGMLGIALQHEQVTLAFADGQATVLPGSNASNLWLRRVSLGGLAQLLLGYRSCADLRATGELDYADTALGLLDVLFPIMG